MYIIKPFVYSYPVLSQARVTILGGGNVCKSLLLTASLLRPNIKFRVIVRSTRSAELIRQFLNDLPRLNVEIMISQLVPDLSNELVVMTIGERTARFSKKSKKENLYTKNQKLITTLLPQLSSSIVIVVTNPSTAITKYLVEQGIQAYGIGVANDQLRFNNQTGETLTDHYFVGAHNFHELILGSRHSTKKTNFLFSHKDYKDILSKQDKKVISVRNLPFSIFDFDWDELEKTNAIFPPEYRWYARQRVHSKFHNTTISCSLAILNTICFFTKRLPLYNNFSLEMPLYFSGTDSDVVIGWPIDGVSMQPLELAFDEPEEKKLRNIASKYIVKHSNKIESTFFLISPFGDCILLRGHPSFVHDFFYSRLAHLFSLSITSGNHNKVLAEITITFDKKLIDEKVAQHNNNEWKIIPQHRGKNPQEHTDLMILKDGESRIVRFPGNEAIGLFEDDSKRASIFCKNNDILFHELRRIIRDEIAIPCLVSRGARILHAGLITFKGLTILILGQSGGGKTTSILSLLCSDNNSSYGSAERTLVWVSDKKILALGIPESVTVFPGTLKQVPEFESFTKRTKNNDLWDSHNKLRLQINDILEKSGCSTIQREISVDLIIEVSYNQEIVGAVSENINEINKIKSIFLRNDLTEDDPVRLSWLNWFPKSYSRKLYDYVSDKSNIDVYTIQWSSIDALNKELIDIVARKKLYSDTFTPARLQI